LHGETASMLTSTLAFVMPKTGFFA
jgi:hypothetical protein